MAIWISDEDRDWEIFVPLDIAISEALRTQIVRIQFDDGHSAELRRRIAERMALSILEVLDNDLKPPTPAQVSFALAIVRDLNVKLPGEALLFKGAMSDFLNRYADLFKERQEHNRRPRKRNTDNES